MNAPLFEIEEWQGKWFFKLGSRYTGPYPTRGAAAMAARREADRFGPTVVEALQAVCEAGR